MIQQMNRLSFIHLLRITWCVVCFLVSVGLIGLWVRSYWCLDCYSSLIGHVNIGAQTLRGCISVFWLEKPGLNFSGHQSIPASRAYLDIDIPGSYFWFRLTKLPAGFSLLIPFWFPLAISVGSTFIPWHRLRFSLRTLLIVTTLVAMVLGLVVWLTS